MDQLIDHSLPVFAPDEADNVNASSVKHEVAANSTGDVLITWQAPHKPNGFIIKYEIRYKRSTDEFVSSFITPFQ